MNEVKLWNELYEKARSVVNPRTVSSFIEAGGVGAAILTDKVWTTFLNVVELYGGDKNRIENLVNNYDDNI